MGIVEEHKCWSCGNKNPHLFQKKDNQTLIECMECGSTISGAIFETPINIFH